MSMKEWLASFLELHTKAKQGRLEGTDLHNYQKSCDELAGALLQAQKLSAKPGEAPRDALRVPRATQVELSMTGGKQKVLTLELGRSSFVAMVALGPATGEKFEAVLRIPGSPDPVDCSVQVTASRRQGGSYRVSFDFVRIDEAAREKIGYAVFDTALENLKV
jgi:hypothetical protein